MDLITSLDDLQFLEHLVNEPTSNVARYFHQVLEKSFQEEVDYVLYSYLSFIGRTAIRKNFSILHVDGTELRTFKALVGGANPNHTYCFLFDKPDDDCASLIEGQINKNYAQCFLYRTSVAEALAAGALKPFDLIIFTNVVDVAKTTNDLKLLLPFVHNKNSRLLLHGNYSTVEMLNTELKLYTEKCDWFFQYTSLSLKEAQIASFTLHTNLLTLTHDGTNDHTKLSFFTDLTKVDCENLHSNSDSFAVVLPAGAIEDSSTIISSENDSIIPKTLLHFDEYCCAHLRGARLAGHSLVLDRKGFLMADCLCAQKELVRKYRFWERPYCSPRKEGDYWLSIPAIEQHCYKKALLLSYAWEENYQHWLFEVLPQVVATDHIGIETLIVSSDIRGYQLRALELLGFSGSNVVMHDIHKTMYCDHLFVGSFTAFNMGWVNPHSFSIFDRLIQATKNTFKTIQPKLVYISRSDAEWKRRLLNEDELFSQLQQLGFVAINPGELTFDDEVQVLSKAKIIVGSIGAGMSNIVFAPPRSEVIAIQSPSFGQGSRFFAMIASARGLNLHSIQAQALNPIINNVKTGSDDNINLLVDVDSIINRVKSVLNRY